MKSDLKKAIDTLNGGEYTCVLCKGDVLYTSNLRGVKPLIDLLDGEADLTDFSAADKVVGKAAALIYVLLGVKEVYAHTMSEGAINVLERNGIYSQYGASTEKIINRVGTGICPMEEAVGDTDNPKEALRLIRKRLDELNKDGG